MCSEGNVLTETLYRIIPKSASGKILRRVLRDQAEGDKGTKLRDGVKERAKL